MNVLGIIPARYASSRLPGKPLADLNGKPLVWHVYERTRQVIAHTIVATDDDRILRVLEQLGVPVVMTSSVHKSGTERCAEALEIYSKQVGKKFDIVVNVQGDEPLIEPEVIRKLIESMKNVYQIGTLIRRESNSKLLFKPDTVKVTIDRNGRAIYFSRQVIPFLRDIPQEQWIEHHVFYTHIGIYAYRSEVLKEIVKLPMSALEKAEKLEQLRWIENGYSVHTTVVDYTSIGVDTPEDLEYVRKLMKSKY